MCPSPKPEGFSMFKQGCSDSSSSPLLLLSSYKETPGQHCPAALARWNSHGLCQHRDQQEKIFIYILRAVTQLQQFTGMKLREKTPGRKLGVTFQGGEPPPSTQYLGSVQNCCGFTKGLGFTVKYQRGARQGDSEGQGSIPAGIWSRKMQRVW